MNFVEVTERQIFMDEEEGAKSGKSPFAAAAAELLSSSFSSASFSSRHCRLVYFPPLPL